MKKNFYRRSIRLPEYDYSKAGAYFITICSFNKEMVFGEIEDRRIVLSEIGKIAANYLEEIPDHFDDVFIDEFIIMPNHIHLILTIAGVQNFEPL